MLVPQVLMAATHQIAMNVRTVLSLNDGDDVELVGFPSYNWGYTRVFMGVNSGPFGELSGGFFVNDCGYELNGFYTQFDFRYSSSIRMTYYGPSADLPIQWWLGSGTPSAACVKSEETPEGVEVKNLIKTIVQEKFRNYSDIGASNTLYEFEGVSKSLKITEMPSGNFNIIKFVIKPLDNKDLDGEIYFGEKKYKLGGSETVISQAPRYKDILPFEMVFNSYRRVSISWSGEVGVPEVTDVAATQEDKGNSVAVEYAFEKTPYTYKSLKIEFNKNDFTDGKAPVVKKYAFNPEGPADEIGWSFSGTLYDISANLKPGKRVTMAIPLDMGYDAEEDTLWFEHFIEEENTWVKVPIDSIVDGYAYFTVDHFCFGWLKRACKAVVKYTVKIGAGVLNVIPGVSKYVDKLANFLSDAVGSVIDGVMNAYEWVREVFADLICFDWQHATEKIAETFVDATTYLVNNFVTSNKGWSIDQGFVNSQNWDQNLINTLQVYRSRALLNINDANMLALADQEDNTCGDIADAGDKLICQQWKATKYNYDTYLADVLLTRANIGPQRFSFTFNNKDLSGILVDYYTGAQNSASILFTTNPGFLDDATWLIEGLQSCGYLEQGLFPYLTTMSQMYDKIKNLNFQGACKEFFDMFSLKSLDVVGNAYNCADLASHTGKVKQMLTSHEKKLIAVSEAMTRASLLAWMDKNNFRSYSSLMLKNVYEGSKAWLSLIAPLMQSNNISTKAYVSLALYEYVNFGTQEMLSKLNLAFDKNYGSKGGYSEGTGYSQYIWDEATYIFAAMKDAYASKFQTVGFSHNFMQSADHMFNTSRPVNGLGNIPVEIDDGVTYVPDYRPWAKLTGDKKYLAMHTLYGMNPAKINPLVAFGVPAFTCGVNECTDVVLDARMGRHPYLRGYFEDGVGVISFKNPITKEVTSLSMIGESGSQFTLGQAHDQQDNLSITLASSAKGPIIQDRGYSGFGNRVNYKFHRFIYHNVLAPLKAGADLTNSLQEVEDVVDIDAQSDNRPMAYSDAKKRYNAFMDQNAGWLLQIGLYAYISPTTFDDLSGNNIYNFRLEGGNAVTRVDKLVDIPANDPAVINSVENGYGVVAYTATLPYSKDGIQDDRTILYFGGSLWVIDQPNLAGMVWLANSPAPNWNAFTNTYGVKLFASGTSNLDETSAVIQRRDCVYENGSVGPYNCGAGYESFLEDYTFGMYDASATTYVMNYNVMGQPFGKYTANCPAGTQCFISSDANVVRKVIVPTKNTRYEMCDALQNDCSLPYETDAIVVATHSNGKWEYQLINGTTYDMNNNGVQVIHVGGTTTLTAYTSYRMDGTSFGGRYQNTYQPAIPLLLLNY